MTAVATESRSPISLLCQRFGQVSGWNLHFTPVTGPVDEVRNEVERRGDCRWLSEIRDGSRTAGFLHLGPHNADYEPDNFDETTRLAESLGTLLGLLAQATSQLTQRNLDVATLLELGLAVPGQDNLAFGLTQLLKAAAHLTDSWSAAFFLLDPGAKRLRLRAVFRLNRDDVPQPLRELKSGSVDVQALADQPVILHIVGRGGHPLVPADMKSAMCAAVQSETAPFGVLWVYDRRGKVYSHRDVHVLQSIAAQLAALLERSALLRGSELNDRINRDLKEASESQTETTTHDFPRDDRFELAARCTSCYELGGDLCEVVALSADRTAIAVGDASGNSIPAAMIMSAVRGAIRTHAAEDRPVTDLMLRLNRALCGMTGAHQFMSLCYGVYDAAQRTFTYSNAGHPVPLLIRDHQVHSFESHGLLLGVVPDSNYQSATVEMQPGDLLILYSDGITEARSSGQELFRWEGISASVTGLSQASAEGALEAVWSRVNDHTGGAGGDDRTLLVLKVM